MQDEDKYSKDLDRIEEYERDYPVTKGFLDKNYLEELTGYPVKEMLVIKHREDIPEEALKILDANKHSLLWTYAIGLGMPSENGGFFLIQAPQSFVIMFGFNEGEDTMFSIEDCGDGQSLLEECEIATPHFDDYLKSAFGGFIGEGGSNKFEDILFEKYGLQESVKIS